MSGGDDGGGALALEQQQLAAQQELLNEKRKKLEEKRIAGLRARFTTGGLQAPGVSATAPATVIGGVTTPLRGIRGVGNLSIPTGAGRKSPGTRLPIPPSAIIFGGTRSPGTRLPLPPGV